MEILELILKGRDIFSSNEEKNIAEFFVGVTRPSKIFSFDLSRIFEVKRTKLLLVFFKHFFNSLVWIFAVTNRNEKIILFIDLYESENNCWKKDAQKRETGATKLSNREWWNRRARD